VVVSDKKAGPPAHPPTRPATGKVKVYFEAYKLDEVDRAVERVADGKARFRAVFVNAA
jgi:D-arabinose 1-dehydrogenase-like Zn-dependent alcohol dehydrogenase